MSGIASTGSALRMRKTDRRTEVISKASEQKWSLVPKHWEAEERQGILDMGEHGRNFFSPANAVCASISPVIPTPPFSPSPYC